MSAAHLSEVEVNQLSKKWVELRSHLQSFILFSELQNIAV